MREGGKDSSRPGKVNDPLIFDVFDQWSVFFSMYRKRCSVYREGGFELDVKDEEPVVKKGVCLFLGQSTHS